MEAGGGRDALVTQGSDRHVRCQRDAGHPAACTIVNLVVIHGVHGLALIRRIFCILEQLGRLARANGAIALAVVVGHVVVVVRHTLCQRYGIYKKDFWRDTDLQKTFGEIR